MHTEEEIIKGCANNDRFYQELLYRRFYPRMLPMCYRYTQDPDTLMSILNDGFLKVFKNIGKYQGTGSFEGWIRKIVFRAISDHFRKESKYLKFLIFEEKDKDLPSNALDKLFFDDVLNLVDQLPNATQKVFTLYAIEGFSHPEISEKLEISVGTSKWHLSEARKKLKSLLKQNNLSHYAG